MLENTNDLMPLVIAILIVGALVTIADIVILIRWMVYRVQLNDALAAAYPMPAGGAWPEGTPANPPAATPPVIDEAAVPDPEATLPAPSPPEGAPQPEVYVAYSAAGAAALPETAPGWVALRPPFAPTWSLVHPFIGIQVALMLTIVLVGIPMFVVMASGHGVDSTPVLLVEVLSLFVQNALFVAVVAYFLRRYGTSLPQIGLRWPTARQIGLGLGLGVLLFVLAQGGGALVEKLFQHLLPHATFESLKKMTEAASAESIFLKLNSAWMKVLFILGGAVAAPIGEEVFFRGFLYNAFKARLNVPWAIVLSGLCFALIHFSPLAVIVIFPMGMALAYVYERTRSLWVTILMHAVNNGVAFLLLWAAPHLGH